MKNWLFLFLVPFLVSCFPYLYYDNRPAVLLDGFDADETLLIAEEELKGGGATAILTVWAMRDQPINEVQAQKVARLYQEYMPLQKGEFEIWHLAWAVANLYRLNDQPVKDALQTVYDDARKQPERLKQFYDPAERMINGDKIWMGDIHDMGRWYARTHLAVPGDKRFVQSYEAYREWKKKQKK